MLLVVYNNTFRWSNCFCIVRFVLTLGVSALQNTLLHYITYGKQGTVLSRAQACGHSDSIHSAMKVSAAMRYRGRRN